MDGVLAKGFEAMFNEQPRPEMPNKQAAQRLMAEWDRFSIPRELAKRVLCKIACVVEFDDDITRPIIMTAVEKWAKYYWWEELAGAEIERVEVFLKARLEEYFPAPVLPPVA